MKTVKLRTLETHSGKLMLQPCQNKPVGMDADGHEATYEITEVPDSILPVEVMQKAETVAFIGTYAARYDQLMPGAIVRG